MEGASMKESEKLHEKQTQGQEENNENAWKEKLKTKPNTNLRTISTCTCAIISFDFTGSLRWIRL